MPRQPQHDGLDETVRTIRTTRGLPAIIARACGCSRQAVYQWRRVPPHWVQTVARILEEQPERIRPDIFRGKHRR